MAAGVQGQLLDINVLGCRNLRDKEWLSRQDPYVVITYASSKLRTKTDTDGGRNPSFNQKFVLPLIEGLREINAEVWNSNTLTFDDFIGSGRILLDKALTTGYDDSTWNLTSKSGRYAGELRVILHFTKTPKPVAPMVSSPYAAQLYSTPPQPYPYAAPPPTAAPYPAPAAPYSSQSYYNPPPQQQHQQQHSGAYSSYGPGPYSPQPYPSPAPQAGYSAAYSHPPPPSPYTHQQPPPYVPTAPASYGPPPTSSGYPPVYQEYPYRPY
ncbi:extensin [Selaginella moellendorffii]|uniref:extensin n=1 Tax=Selaginella moellendorffii TaxID=88036 RepID=UPI000D1CC23B|nr:extensin [Selaginella moellendorffii]|eukprot:XP_002960506.2 extensin [Selaginella moellendorffii]